MKDDFETEELLFLMKRINLNLAARMELSLRHKSITGDQTYFLVYILRNHTNGTYLTELCRETGVSKPTLSALIKKLREKDYLYYHSEPDDIRKKKVLPTAKLVAEGEEMLRKTEQMEEKILSALDSRERELLRSLEQKLIAQLAGMEAGETDREKNRQEVNYHEKSDTAAQAI